MLRTRYHSLTRRYLTFLSAATLAVALALPSANAAEGDLVVMTQNLYLGSSLQPALEAATPDEFVEAVARIYATVQYTNFPARAEAIADEIQATKPDVIGLQEVTKWTTEGLNPPPGYDFLEILQGELTARGLHYSVAAVSNNASIGPMPLVVSQETCPVLEGPTFTCGVTLDDRDVILVNDDTVGLSWSNPQSGQYADQLVIDSPVGSLSFDRGWASIDAELSGRSFRFVNTHLETEDAPAVQEAQAAEFLAGPGSGAGQTIIAVGDFNSAADGSTTGSYALLTGTDNFSDAWDEGEFGPGWTCCQQSNTPPLAPGALNNPVSTLATRIDLILGRGLYAATEAQLVGDSPFQAEPPFWPSDHAGVVASFQLGQANFHVTKTFSDGNDSEVDVTLTCNSGVPLKQTFTIAGGDPAGVKFVVQDIPDGGANCEVTESGGPAGYTPVMNGGAGCAWEGVVGGSLTCEITNTADPASFTVYKEWVIENGSASDLNQVADVTVYCNNEIDGGSWTGSQWRYTATLYGDDSVEVTVDTTQQSAQCYAMEDINQQTGIEFDTNCDTQVIVAGGSASCKFINTVFFEGIPTLGQWGLAILVLLTLGIGLVAVRRIV